MLGLTDTSDPVRNIISLRKKLAAVEPEHSLLGYIEYADAIGFSIAPGRYREFLGNYAPTGRMSREALEAYVNDLETALEMLRAA